ncbi:MAG TPA: universal stress protein [Solirubrobacteraceae bacterium]|nr:universal stress protein [Solirubrobacteraceae bacterium]
MFSTIVIGVDGREGGRDALALADRLRRVFGGELVAVYAYSHDFFATRGINPDFESVMHGHANDLVENELDRAGVKAHAVALADGSPARALHKAAKWHDSDLIVVGSDHHGPIGRVVAGDVTLGTLHGAECPVVVAPRRYSERAGAIRTIGVGYDGSPESHAAAWLARDLAVAAGARLRVISVLQPPGPGGSKLTYDPYWAENAEAIREEGQRQLDDLLAELGEIATGDVVVGDPANELSYAGNELDLLVTGARGYGPVRRVMLGSTSSKLVHRAPCPVLVLTRTAIDDDEPADVHAGAQEPVAG